MSSSAKVPVDSERRRPTARWSAYVLLFQLIGVGVALAVISKSPPRLDGLRMSAVILMAGMSIGATWGSQIIHSRKARQYGTLLRIIHKSKQPTPVRTATTTAIDSVADRIHGNRTSASVILASALVLVLFFNLRWEYTIPPAVIILLTIAILLLNASTLALDYRVSHGLFGTNEYEAREIVRFVLRNSSNNDFSGGLGARQLDLSASAQAELAAIWSGEPAYE